MILETEEGIEVVGEAADGTGAIALALELAPDVICMDVQMPGMDGLEATRRIVASGSAAGILVLTTFNRDDYLFDALKAGASGFVLKNATPESMVEAVQVVARGEALLSPDVTRTVIEHLVGGIAAAPRGPDRRPAQAPQLHDLTEREREVLGLLAAGRSNAEIARELYLGEATVKTHVSKILSKLGLRDRIQAVVFGYENGIVVPGVPPAG
ncbi:DNA-binding response regulator [Subtercola boreus]|uniref:DNA-binding response regulator n=1 Tax=Subtercola boreus TaxID=120213 RepID=A0A3E0VVS6_9MICO|nr:DNA-binding response regulator [Subtercola boreus]